MLCRVAADEVRLGEDLSISAAEAPYARKTYKQCFENIWQRRFILVSVIAFALFIVLCCVQLQDSIISRVIGGENEISVILFNPSQSESVEIEELQLRSKALDQTELIELSGALILSNQSSSAPTNGDVIELVPQRFKSADEITLETLKHPEAEPINDTASEASAIAPDINYARLYALLREAAMSTNTVIITVFDGARRDITDLFISHFRDGEGTGRLMQHIVVLNSDKESFDFCQEQKPLCCYFDKGVNVLSDIPLDDIVDGSAQSYQSRLQYRIEWRKVELMREVLRFGYNVLFTDNDILFFKDPFPYLKSTEDFQLASDVYDNGRNVDHINAGLYLVKHNPRSHQMYDAWLQDYKRRDLDWKIGNSVPQIFDMKHGNQGTQTLRFLEPLKFATLCRIPDDLREIVTLHAECLDDKEDRLVNLHYHLGMRKEQLKIN